MFVLKIYWTRVTNLDLKHNLSDRTREPGDAALTLSGGGATIAGEVR
jgi:hypothetical protein